MTKLRGRTLALACAALLSGCDHPATGPRPPAGIAIVAGDVQVRSAGRPVRISPTVRVTDADGKPVRGVPVTFVGSRTAVVSPPVVVTGRDGLAALTQWSVRTEGGEDTLVAKVEEIGSVTFTATSIVFTDISVADHMTCALITGGAAYCWGINGLGQLGTGDTLEVHRPTASAGGYRFRTIAAGGLQTCGLTLDSQVLCAGYSIADQPPDPRFVEVGGGRKFKEIAVTLGGPRCGIGEDLLGYCWGNQMNDVVNGTRSPVTPVPLPASSNPPIRELAANFGLSPFVEPDEVVCALDGTGRARCWNLWGFPGALSYPPADSYDALTVGAFFGCGLTHGETWCWGRNSNYSLGVPDFVDLAKVPIPFATQIRAAAFRTCAVTATGIFCWGDTWLPEQVPGTNARAYTRLSVSNTHACALDTSGTAWCWGRNDHGQLGDGTTTDSPIPMAVPFDL